MKQKMICIGDAPPTLLTDDPLYQQGLQAGIEQSQARIAEREQHWKQQHDQLVDENAKLCRQIDKQYMRLITLESGDGIAKAQYDKCMHGCEEPSPVERLRFFCSFAMRGQDWFDVEPFINDLSALEAENKNLSEAYDCAIKAHRELCDATDAAYKEQQRQEKPKASGSIEDMDSDIPF